MIFAVNQGNYNLKFFAERKIPDMVYCHNHLGSDVVCSEATVTVARGDQGLVGMVSREQPEGWIFESTHFHGMNVVSYNIVTVDH